MIPLSDRHPPAGRRLTSQAVRLAVVVDEELFADRGDQLREQLREIAVHRLSGLLPSAEPVDRQRSSR